MAVVLKRPCLSPPDIQCHYLKTKRQCTWPNRENQDSSNDMANPRTIYLYLSQTYMKKEKIIFYAIVILAAVSGAMAFKMQKITDRLFLLYTSTLTPKCLPFTNYTTDNGLGGIKVSIPPGYVGFYTNSFCTGSRVTFAYFSPIE